jgi:hypothetical protein
MTYEECVKAWKERTWLIYDRLGPVLTRISQRPTGCDVYIGRDFLVASRGLRVATAKDILEYGPK